MNLDIKIDFNEIFDKAFAALAKAMNIAEEQLLPILAKQMFIEGVTGLAILASFLLLIIILIIGGFLWDRFFDGEGVGLLVSGAAFIVGGFIWLLSAFTDGYLMDSVTKTFNPEYAVIEEVVDMAGDLFGKEKE